MLGNKFILIGLVLSLIAVNRIEARPVHVLEPEELETQASLICNGTVVSIEEVGVRDNSYPGVIHEMRMRAKVKVLHLFKGTAPDEIELQYTTAAPARVGMMNAPLHIGLQKGKRYRFFLKAAGLNGEFVGVLDGKIDDDFAVEALSPDEPDTSPYLHQDEAIKLASDDIRSKHPGVSWDSDRTIAHCLSGSFGTYWEVFLFKTPTSNSVTWRVEVLNDRKVYLDHLPDSR